VLQTVAYEGTPIKMIRTTGKSLAVQVSRRGAKSRTMRAATRSGIGPSRRAFSPTKPSTNWSPRSTRQAPSPSIRRRSPRTAGPEIRTTAAAS